MIEIFKQFKKADDASTLVMRTSTKEMDKNERIFHLIFLSAGNC